MDVFPLGACAGLFGTTFLQESFALGAGAALIMNGAVPAAWVGLSLFLGIVCGDCSVYALGALARRSDWARRLIARVDMGKAERSLSRHLLTAVPACHLVPWLLFPTFAAYGWFKVPFERFVLTSLAFNALYVPLVLVLFTRVGSAATPYLGAHTAMMWLAGVFLLSALIAVRLFGFRRSPS